MPDRDQLQWLVLKDFSAGIWQITRHQSLSGQGGNYGLASQAPLGAGTVDSFGCIALPQGGLGPLPMCQQVNVFSTQVQFGDHIVGFDAFGPVAVGTPQYGPDEWHVGIERDVAFYWLVVDAYDGSYTVWQAHSRPSLLSSNQRWGMSFAHTRVNPASPTEPGHPVVVTSWGGRPDSPGFVGWWPAEPGGSRTANIVNGRYGKVFGHQGRLVLLETMAMIYVHPGATFLTDDHVSFTGPNNNNLGTQRQVFLPEYPSGYGAVGSVSAGELFMVKHDGGAVLVQGDISSPSLIRMPGVTPTGFVSCKPAACQLGLVYYSNQLGAWLWRGEDTSVKISYQLEDDFCYASPYIGGVNNEVVHFEQWGEWVLASGGWLWDTRTQGWFRVEPYSTWNTYEGPIGRIAASVNGRFVYATRYKVGPTPHIPVVVMDRNRLADHWEWRTHPIAVNDPDLILEVRELVLVAQAASSTGTIRIILYDYDNWYDADTGPLPVPTFPSPIRVNISFRSAAPSIAIIAQSNDSVKGAPVLYELRIGYQLRRRIGTTVGV
jgi:hypothetical protein